jgi:hypothetical protein
MEKLVEGVVIALVVALIAVGCYLAVAPYLHLHAGH